MNAPESPAPPSSAPRHAVLLAVGLLAAAALAAYLNTFTAPFVLDDAGSVSENPTIRQLWPLWGAFSPPGGGVTVSGRPVVNFTLAVNYAISGEEVWSYHALNLVIHFLAALTLFGVVRRTLGRPLLRPRFGEARLALATAIAGIWMLHPLQTESVTYVSQRSESLAGLFCLLTLYAFIRATESSGTLRPMAWRAASWAACLLGMATKEVMVATPLLVLLYDLTLVRGGSGGGLAAAWRQRRGYYVALAATWIVLGLLVAGSHDRGGTAGFQSGLTPAIYLKSQCHAIAVYFQLCFWPHPLVFDYGQAVISRFADVWPQAVMVGCLLLATAVALWRRSAAGFVGAVFFAILAPSSSLVPVVSQTMAEHRMYLPLAAFVVLVVLGVHAGFGRRSLVLWPMLAVGLGWLTFERNATYGSALALWGDTVARAPHNARARYNLSIVYSERGQYRQAIEQDEAGLRLDNGWAAARQAPATLNKLAHDLAESGRLPEAVAHYEQALRLNPNYALVHLNLARAFVRLDRYAEALRHFEEAARLKPGGWDTESELGNALLHEGRAREALIHCQTTVQLRPAWAPGFNNLAYALVLAGRGGEAIAAYREAARIDPRYAAAWLGLGYALIGAGRPGEAVAPCTESVRLQPGSADAHNVLGIAFAQTGRTADAIASFEQALRLDGGSGADVHDNLGNALASAGRTTEAIAQYREALRLNPDYAPAHRNLGEELRRAGRKTEAEEQLTAAARLESAGETRRPPAGN